MVGIIILNYNTWKESKQCVESIVRTVQDISYHIYLVDNGSSEKMSKEEKEYFSSINNLEIVIMEQNRGYSAGNNVGIEKAKEDGCDFFLLSNSDIEFGTNAIVEMYRFLRNNPTVGIVAPLLYDTAGLLQPISMLEKFTLSMKYKLLLNKLSFGILFKKFRDCFFITELEQETPLKVFSVSGACLMLSKICIDHVCPLDENTFLYYEEYILGCRMEKKHMDTYIIPYVNCIHVHGASTEKIKEFSYVCMIKSELYYCREYLKCKKYQLIPLYAIRVLVYIKLYGTKNLRQFICKTW